MNKLVDDLVPYEWMVEGDLRSAWSLRELVSRIRTSGICALVGAGIGAAYNLPTWTDLLDELAEEIEGLVPNEKQLLSRLEDQLWRAEEYKSRLTNEELFRFIKRRFGAKLPANDTIIRDLVSIKFRHIFTTNYDTFLEQCHDRCRDDRAEELDWTNVNAVRTFLASLDDVEMNRKYVHLHGRYDRPECIVLTHSDYVLRYLKQEDMRQRLFALFATKRFLFVGFSLSDPDFVQILREVTSLLGWADTPAHYAILPMTQPELVAVERRRLSGRFDIEPIYYQHHPNDNHRNLAKAIAAIRELQEVRVEPLEIPLRNNKTTIDSVVPGDKQKKRWGEKKSCNGRELTASVTRVTDRWFRIDLRVSSVIGASPLTGVVIFHLHETFFPEVREVTAEEGIATLTIHGYGAFTVGAETDNGQTRLELDLSEDVQFPEIFRKA